jgi:hypothetical protein
MKIRKTELLIGLTSFFIFNLIAVPTIFAATTGSVNATVTAQNVALTVTDGGVSYGTLAVDSSKTTLTSPGLGDQQTVTNTGNVAEDFTIEGQDSGDWTLDSVNTTEDHYVHGFCTASCGTDSSPTNFTALTTSYQSLASDVAASGTQDFDLMITTPVTSSVYTSQTVNVTVLAAAH